MDGLIYLLFFVFFVAAVSSALKSKRKRKFKYDPNGEWPFEKERLLTNPEQVLYFRLREALPDYCVFAQVQLSQLISVRKGHDFNQWFNRINRMSADFVVTDKAMEIIAVIELDDKTHLRPDRVAADRKKETALMSAEIEVIRCSVSQMPTVDKIKEFFNLTEKATAPASVVSVKKREAPTIEQLRQANISAGKPANSGIKWTLIESEELAALHGEKKSIKELAIQFERTEIAIMAQLEKISPSKVKESI